MYCCVKIETLSLIVFPRGIFLTPLGHSLNRHELRSAILLCSLIAQLTAFTSYKSFRLFFLIFLSYLPFTMNYFSNCSFHLLQQTIFLAPSPKTMVQGSLSDYMLFVVCSPLCPSVCMSDRAFTLFLTPLG